MSRLRSCCNRFLVLHCPKWTCRVGEEGMCFIHTSVTIIQCIPQLFIRSFPLSGDSAVRMRGTVVQRIVSWFCPVTLFFRCHGILTMWSGVVTPSITVESS
ncbi:uncharacterized protein ASPGLDRAFT_1302552 [Aspergillus glaucus CBS 516.65]|uniref:Uncharacterized protein n=1 Tax=Aspergillus glaucus CBS 516.65 TaxID=1160497 RepID=A0A1L9VQ15_ASPGL|nr:hypothetical protein ASPGLDRAFT_1302552 [Aspergillus glaucus CBS 516.65]OJJ86005.1 hypothetical protein ASPGLDRAFT_1302552 [Aspergillus glaucus CBS 516.65]